MGQNAGHIEDAADGLPLTNDSSNREWAWHNNEWRLVHTFDLSGRGLWQLLPIWGLPQNQDNVKLVGDFFLNKSILQSPPKMLPYRGAIPGDRIIVPRVKPSEDLGTPGKKDGSRSVLFDLNISPKPTTESDSPKPPPKKSSTPITRLPEPNKNKGADKESGKDSSAKGSSNGNSLAIGLGIGLIVLLIALTVKKKKSNV